MTNFHGGLILEGGGMRGVYTAGVLDFFLDEGIMMEQCYGVSAGAANAMNYLSGQRGRTYRTTVNYINDKRYCSMRNWLTTGDLFGADFLYNRIPNEIDLFDYEAFQKSTSCMTVVVTNVVTGLSEYKQLSDLQKEMQWVRASCSLPLASRIVSIDGGKYLDGGITDSIPLQRAMRDGYEKNIVVLTRHEGYRKEPEKTMAMLGKVFYARYPRTVEEGAQRHVVYNKQLDFLEEQQHKGHAFVIRPKEPVGIDRVERNKEKLTALYEQGYKDAKEKLKEIQQFLGVHPCI